MSAAAQTKIFGIRVGLDPKILAGGLIAVAVALYWYNSRSDDTAPAVAVQPHNSAAPATSGPRRRPVMRRQNTSNDRGTLRLRAVDASSGKVDPTLRLDLLARVQTVPAAANMRNLFEIGPAPATAEQTKPIKGPIIVPTQVAPPVANSAQAAQEMAVNIPLKYYGFAQPAATDEGNRGFFLDGDNVLVATEGELLDQRYLIVELSPNSARVEDTQVKKGQTLTLVAEALP